MLKLNDLSKRQNEIMALLADGNWLEATNIVRALSLTSSPASIKRDIRALFLAGQIERFGSARATKYRRALSAQLMTPIDVNKYFAKPQDERCSGIRFNLNIFSQLKSVQIFTAKEKLKLTSLLKEYTNNIKNLSSSLLKREFERVTIDLSWKSASIEGNTYTLLETETLLKDGIPALGKTSEETTMLINHKLALDFIRKNHREFENINVSKIEHVHAQLSQHLGISKAIRKRMVGIIGTNYKPLENEFQIRENLEKACKLINDSKDVFEKTILAILFISYIQPFEDGNKRTARLIGNAILLAHECFPLSFRSVEVNSYKKAILLFYEINNLYEFKNIFLDQAQFAVKEYFQ